MFAMMGLGSTQLTSKIDVRVFSAGVRLPAVALLVLLCACAPAPKLRVIGYCDLPHSECGPLAELPPEIQAQLQEQAWCCPDGQPCFPVNAVTDCAITDVAIYCEWGRSTPASTEGGTSGFECFG